jgi:hypothetical protein
MTRSIFYVYVALGKVSGQYKIGFSRDVRNRFRSLPEAIDVNRSFYVECSASMPARRMEFILHFILHPYRILEPGPGRGPEWFEPACYGPLQSFVEEHHERLGVSELRPATEWRRAEEPPPPPPPPWTTDEFLTNKHAAKILQRSARRLKKWRLARTGPPFYRQGRVIRYLLSEVLAWGASRRVAPDTAA